MSLRKKTFLIVSAFLASILLVSVFISYRVILEGFIQVEKVTVTRNLDRFNKALDEDLKTLEGITRDWSAWDDTYKFINDRNKDFISSNLKIDESFINNRLSFMVFVNNKGDIVFSKGFDLSKNREIPLFESIKNFKGENKFLTEFPDIEKAKTGIIFISDTSPVILSSQPILKSDRTGPKRGTLIFGRLLDNFEINKLSDQTNLKAQISILDNNLTPNIEEAKNNISGEKPVFMKSTNDEIVHGYKILKDISGNDALMLGIEIPREIYKQGLRAVQFSNRSIAVAGILFTILILVFLNKHILSRLMLLDGYLPKIGKDLSVRFPDLGNDEIGSLAKSTNEMLEKLQNSQNDLQNEKEGVEQKVKERTAQLEREQARLQASINSLNMGFFITNVESDILMINSAAKRLLCMGETGIVSPGTVLDPGSIKFDCKMSDLEKQLKGVFDIRAAVEKCIQQRNTLEIKDLVFRNIFLHIYITPIALYKENGIEVIGTATLIDDITEEKILERSKDEFFSIASHELRTPLTAIRGNTALIKQIYPRLLKDKELKSMIDDIGESSVRLIEIVNDFLDVSRLEQKRLEFKKEEFDLKQLLIELTSELKANISDKKLYLRVESTPKLSTTVLVDKNRTKQVFYNLIGNSIKFTQKGGISLTIVPDGELLNVLISDTGMGIDSSKQNLLFKKFQQVGGESIYTRDSTKGTGLGLYISKLLIEGMGGKISLEQSIVGEGTTFSVKLPAKKLPIIKSVNDPKPGQKKRFFKKPRKQ